MKFAKGVVKYRVAILIVAVVLLIPALYFMMHTRVNYDMLTYLPSDMETVIGQDRLKEEFGKGAFSFMIVEGMDTPEVVSLKEEIQKVEHVDTVLWYDSVLDPSIPMELLPDRIYQAFNQEDSTLMAIFFDSGTSEEVTLEAVEQIRAIAGKQCFLSGMSAMVVDLRDLCEQEEPVYVLLAVALALVVMLIFLDNWVVTKDSPNYENALMWINFVMDPDNMAMILEEFPYLCANVDAIEKMGESYSENLAKNPPAEAIAKGSYVQNLSSDVLDIYSEMWTKLKE